jgi:O-antigen/teichoic acid export membrane protein
MSLKNKTITGFFWSFADNTGNQVVQFVIGIVLARILTPSDYGIVGIVTVILVILQAFVDSGFSQALIRKLDVSQSDYSTVFFFNLIVGFVLYILLFVSSPFIADFFNQQILTSLIKVLGLNLLISSLTIVQRSILTKQINFKLLTKISLVSNALSGIIGIILAFSGYGVWSIVYRSLLNVTFSSGLLWAAQRWIPSLEFDVESFKSMYRFGYKLLLSSLLDKLYQNIYYFVIGKFFSPSELGLYTRADQFKSLFSSNLHSTIARVSYPALASLQNDDERLKNGYKKVLEVTMYLSSLLILLLGAIAYPLILVLLGEKWIGAADYLQPLCIVGIFFPLHAINLNIITVKGRSDLFLKLEIIKKILAVPTIFIGIFYGIDIMIYGMIINSFIAYWLNSQYSGVLVNYSMREQIKDILPVLGFTFSAALLVYPISFLNFHPIIILGSQITLWAGISIFFGEKFNLFAYLEIKRILFDKLGIAKNKNA